MHITSTVRSIGATVAVSKILGLSPTKTTHAIGLAATQVTGLREMFGSYCKSFHVGRSAQNGLLAAVMAEGGYTSSQGALEAKRGWATVAGTNKPDVLQNLDLWLGTENEDGLAGQTLAMEGHSPAQIESIAAQVHLLVLEPAGKKTPKDGLEAKFSVYHSGACGLLLGRVTSSDYEDNIVLEPAVIAIRDRTTAKIDTSIAADSARVTVALEDGEVFTNSIYNASIVVWDPYSSSTQRVVSLPGISHSGLEASDKRLSGTVIDSTNDVLSAVVQADEFFLSGGNDVSGDNLVVKIDLNTFAVKQINLTTTTKGQYGAFIDIDNGLSGDLYVNGGYPSSILHIDCKDKVSPLYVREPTTAPRPFGFGGVVRVSDNLIASDNTNHQLVRFTIQSGHSSPVVIPQTNYHNFSGGGSLSLPHKYGGKVLLMAEDILAKNTTGVSVFSSMDGWKTAKFVGFIESIDRKLEPASVAISQTSAHELGDRIYSSVLFYDNKINPSMAGNRTDFALRDITDSVDSLLQANGFYM
ncbi:uncharacterized protein FOBCDRAFT_314856 [Fusarium oxysporum Fo47]|uniref:uncharacterized protein n=1 Tax=Fusarium oxysporum Fo47 TaxID=660027 RepID=UPI002869BC66|nr:uncharacterized protein FOBCDRAFT_314856 [Fusarium oxysporum Fo47]WJG34562.1 hypothetical protein FOBCDRAFT_314856 [Fusarium oxysporum Fo47]